MDLKLPYQKRTYREGLPCALACPRVVRSR